jgi:MFS family permease
MTRLRRSLRASVVDGAACAAMVGAGELYFPAFGLFLGASPFQVGLLTTIPILAGSLAQLLAPRVAHGLGDKPFVVGGAVAQGLLFAPLAGLALLSGDRYPWLLAAATLYSVYALGINTVWNAWIGRLVPASVRSRFFARRAAAVSALLVASNLLGGFILHASEHSAWGAASGFVVVFSFAGLARLVSARFLGIQHDPRHGPPPPRPPLGEVWRELRTSRAGRLVALLVLVMGSVHLSASYFTPYMLGELGLSYAQYTILSFAGLGGRIVFSPYWGEVARRCGNRRALQVACTLVVPLSASWLVSHHFAYLIVVQLSAGFAWAGFELALVLNLLDATDDRTRARVLSLYNLLNGLAIVAGSLCGGLVLRGLGANGYATLFIVSSLLRGLVVLVLARRVGVHRPGEPTYGRAFLRTVSFGLIA